MPPEILSAIGDGRRPAKKWRLQMVRVLADEIRKYNPNPSRSECRTVCAGIVRQYPNCFGDLPRKGTEMAGGHASLLEQVKIRIENINRSGLYRQRCSKGLGRHHGPADTYGCTRFQPQHSSEETADTLEEKRCQMENIYIQEGLDGGQRGEVIHLMETTYSLQRTHINEEISFEDLRSKWPYLFTQRGIYAHFELLTDVKVLQVLEHSIEECGQSLVEFFRTQSKKSDVRAIVSQCLDGDLTLHVVQLLTAHFGESQDGLLIFANVSFDQLLFNIHVIVHMLQHNSFISLILTFQWSDTSDDVERKFVLPASPRLILLSKSFYIASLE